MWFHLPTDVNRESAQDFAFQYAYVYSLSQRVTQQKLESGTLELNSILSVLQRVERSYLFPSSSCQSPSEQYQRDLQTRDSRRIWPEKSRKSRCVQRWSSTWELGLPRRKSEYVRSRFLNETCTSTAGPRCELIGAFSQDASRNESETRSCDFSSP